MASFAFPILDRSYLRAAVEPRPNRIPGPIFPSSSPSLSLSLSLFLWPSGPREARLDVKLDNRQASVIEIKVKRERGLKVEWNLKYTGIRYRAPRLPIDICVCIFRGRGGISHEVPSDNSPPSLPCTRGLRQSRASATCRGGIDVRSFR